MQVDRPYAELCCKSNFSFLEGAAHAIELVTRADELGYRALAITDRNTLAGIVRAHGAAKDLEFPLIIGAQLDFVDALSVVVWASTRSNYAQLARLITLGRRQAEKGAFRLSWVQFAEHAQDLWGAVMVPVGGDEAADKLNPYRELWGPRCSLLADLHYGPDDRGRLDWYRDLARKSGIAVVASGDVHYHKASRQPLHDVLTATRLGLTVDQLQHNRLVNAQRHLRTKTVITQQWARCPEAIERTIEIAEHCTFSLDELRYEYPEELAPGGQRPMEYLRELARQGAKQRYPQGIPASVQQLIEHELSLIESLRYEAYFLTVWDLVRFARSQKILCQGRGSAANSAVCYCLGITSVDPARSDLLFERFMSRERNEAPDIDVDFEHERREEVLQYIYQKYGRDRAGMTGVVITYRSRSAVRDVGKALGLSLDKVDALAKQVEGYATEPKLDERCRQVGIDPESSLGRRLLHLVDELTGFPRHLSQHVGGMVITQGPLCELVPIENAAMEGRTVIQWDKDDLDELGILKVDCLSLGMLSAIRRCFEKIRIHTGREFTLANIPAEDPRVYEMICRADTIGVFQIESRAQMSMLPRLKPRCYYDLVIEVAIVRPGPIQGQMVHPYLRRRDGVELVRYPSREIYEVLHKTLGVPLFQEQAMRMAVVAAGFTPGEADELRRAMGAWRRPGLIDHFRNKLLQGMEQRGLSREFAEQVFQQIRGFGEYGFPESHAASFALLVYVSAWLKRFYPAVFTASVINSQPMGFYAPAQLIRDAQEHGVEVRPVDINFSDWDCTLEDGPGEHAREVLNSQPRLRLGLRMLSGFSEKIAEELVAERRGSGAFESVAQLQRRTGVSQTVITRLAEADALKTLGRNRRQTIWESLAQEQSRPNQPLFSTLDDDEPHVDLPEMDERNEVFADYQTMGHSLRGHPLSFHRDVLNQLGAVCAKDLQEKKHGQTIRVAGLVLLRQRPSTAKGITFVTLEDETGTANLVVHQKTWDRFYKVARTSSAWLALGHVEKKDRVIHVVVKQIADLAERVAPRNVPSRDFR
ncbi:MAG TPA: DNA polymerase III subunit alpha [Planctomycetaceae bacterium]|nr:DNA polymerase III subunit alpha [Planctomycetaceae bacterium]